MQFLAQCLTQWMIGVAQGNHYVQTNILEYNSSC